MAAAAVNSIPETDVDGEQARQWTMSVLTILKSSLGEESDNYNQVKENLEILLYNATDPWGGSWNLSVGDVIDAEVLRRVERADRCNDVGGYLIALRPGALTMLCGIEDGRYAKGDKCVVKITSIDGLRKAVAVELMP